jgi:hypothetical protein
MKVVLTFLLLFGVLSCGPSAPETPAPASPPSGNAALIRHPRADASDSLSAAEMTFSQSTYDFGTAPAGRRVRHTFSFTNTGDYPLLITAARSSCGCTVASYPERPVQPGKRGEVTVAFDTAGKSGQQRKPIVLTANTLPSTTTIFLQGTVVAK